MKDQLRLAMKAALQQCYADETLTSGELPEEIQL